MKRYLISILIIGSIVACRNQQGEDHAQDDTVVIDSSITKQSNELKLFSNIKLSFTRGDDLDVKNKSEEFYKEYKNSDKMDSVEVMYEKSMDALEARELKEYGSLAFNRYKLKDNPDLNIIDEEASKIVYGKIKFGITRKEYKKIMADPYDRYSVGNYEYSFNPVFDKTGELYLLEISSFYENASKIETELNDSKNNLRDVISQKYGSPVEDYGNPDFFKFKPGYIQWQYKWDVYTKTILIGISEANSGSRYKTVMWIYDQPTKNRIDNEDKDKYKKNTLNDAKQF
ncbi:hypothetical protein [Sphingobacterium sp. UBA2074]|uniref:hypothetical protein n=1 Tax=Sphingobacterium sp. UBA2074 TaxID=1947487 RepID=UPI00257DE56E|nr:hypothetical protein [Sphingobacterium sp. UBA2074]